MRAAIVLASCVLASCGSTAREAPHPPAPITAVGRLDTAEEARHLVAAADGVIERVWVSRGDSVHRGQALLQVACDPKAFSAEAQAAAAAQADADARTIKAGARPEEIAAAEAELHTAQSTARDQADAMQRTEQLESTGFVTKRDVEARRNASAASDSQVQAAEARLALLRHGSRITDIAAAEHKMVAARDQAHAAHALADQCILRSPINGVVLQILRREGEFSGASQGSALIVVGDLAHLVVRAEVNEHDAAGLHVGENASVRIDGMPAHWQGKVVQLASIMGRREARSLDPTDRFDRDSREAIIELRGALPPPLVGLRVMVEFAS